MSEGIDSKVKHSIRCLVTSDKMDKTRVATVERKVREARTGKFIKRTTKLMFHDEKNISKIGDEVLVVSSKPISARKKFKLVTVIGKNS